MMNQEEIREALSGPVPSVRLPFNEDGAIDYQSLRKMIDFDIDAGAKTIMLTYGDSLYSILTDDELAEVTKVTVEHTAGRAMVIAADRMWSTPKEVEFAKYCREVGADMLMALPPDWARSCTPETLVDYYSAVGEHIPVMIVTNYLRDWGLRPAIEALKNIYNKVPAVAAVKDDFCGEFMRRLCMMAHDKWALISGGQMQNHLDCYPYGVDGYLATFITFQPGITHEYWDAIQAGDVKRAAQVIQKYDWPFFDFIRHHLGSSNGGFDAGMHGTMELFGIAKRWRRKPYYSLNDEEMERLKDFLKSRSIL